MLTIITLLSVYYMYLKMQYQSGASAKLGNVVDRKICNFIALQICENITNFSEIQTY